MIAVTAAAGWTGKKRWKKLIKTGRFNLHQDLAAPTVFEVSWKRSNDKYGRRRFQAESVERAIGRAPIGRRCMTAIWKSSANIELSQEPGTLIMRLAANSTIRRVI